MPTFDEIVDPPNPPRFNRHPLDLVNPYHLRDTFLITLDYGNYPANKGENTTPSTVIGLFKKSPTNLYVYITIDSRVRQSEVMSENRIVSNDWIDLIRSGQRPLVEVVDDIESYLGENYRVVLNRELDFFVACHQRFRGKYGRR
jgi:hypothetical protein